MSYTNTTKELKLKFNPRTGKYILPYNRLKNVVIRAPRGFQDSGLNIIITQNSNNTNLNIGVSAKLPKLQSGNDLNKLSYAARVLESAFNQRNLKDDKTELVKILSNYDPKDVVGKITPVFVRNLQTVRKWRNQLSKNKEIIKKNISTEKYSSDMKKYLTKSIDRIDSFLQKELVSLCSQDINLKIPEISAIPRSVVVSLTERPILIQIRDNLLNFFFSKKKPGPTLTVKELLNKEILGFLGKELSALTNIYAFIVRNLYDQSSKDDRADLEEFKINMLPPDISSCLNNAIPTIRRSKKGTSVTYVISMINRHMRLTYDNNMVTKVYLLKYFPTLTLTFSKMVISSRETFNQRLLELKSKGTLDEKALVQQYLKYVYHTSVERINMYGLKELWASTKIVEKNFLKISFFDDQLKDPPKTKVFVPPDQNDRILFEKDYMVNQNVKDFIMTTKSKKKAKPQSGFAKPSKNLGPFLRTIKKSKVFSKLYDELFEFLHSFSNSYIQARAIKILFAELQRIQLKLEEDDDYQYVADYESDSDSEDEEVDDFSSLG